MVRFGHFCSAFATGSPVRIPYFFAGMDLAVTTPWRVEISPPTMEGIVLRSTAEGSSFSCFTADQERRN